MRRLMIFGLLVLAACNEDGPLGPVPLCEFEGITETDASGALIGSVDPTDWCDGVVAAPNPAAALTTIRFALTQDQLVRIVVHGEDETPLRTLVDEFVVAGLYAITWDMTTNSGVRVDPGIYCVTLQSDEFSCSGDIDVRN